MRVCQKAFSLIEILLVASLLIVLAVVAVPNFSKSYQTLLLTNTAEDLAYLMRYAQSRAIVRQNKICLVFDSSFSKAELQEAIQSQPDVAGAYSFQKIPGRWGRPFKIPETLSLKSEDTVLTFNPDGSTDTAMCTLCDSAWCRSVILNGKRGRVSITENEKRGADDF